MWMITSFCQNFIDIMFPKKCYLCSKEGNTLCEGCLSSFERPLDSTHHFISSLYSFKDIKVKRVVHAIKFFHRKDLVDPLSKKLLSLLPTDDAGWVVVPIPAHPLRRISRGYNQSELLASAISKESGIPVKMDILRKTKYTERQVTAQTKAERLNRQRNSFKVTGPLPYTNIILIDDVTTTGTTLLEARSCLIKNGASKVLAITVAH